MKNVLHIALDGPVAAGKGTIASELARRLNISYVESGAMYRAVGLIGLNDKISLSDEKALIKAVSTHKLTIKPSKKIKGACDIFVDGENITDNIRSPQISAASSQVAVHPLIRSYLVKKQRAIAKKNSVVMEGRDIGTVVLPDADVKVYLTADIAIRAKRRQQQQKQKGIIQTFKNVLQETKDRDYNDMHRKINPLKPAEGALYLDTTNLSIDEVVEKIMEKIPRQA